MTARTWKRGGALWMETEPMPGEYQFTISRFHTGDRIAYGLFQGPAIIDARRDIDPTDERARACAIAELKAIAEQTHVNEQDPNTAPRRTRMGKNG